MKYSLRYIKEYWKSLAIYFFIALTLATICFVLLNAYLSINKTISYETNNYSNMFSLEINSKKFDDIDKNERNKIKSPTKETLINIGKSKYVDNYDVFLSTDLYTRTLQSANYTTKPKLGIFSLRGVDKNFLMDQDIGNIRIIDGVGPENPNFFKKKNSILISKYVAEKNRLKLNDKIKLSVSAYLGPKLGEKKYPFPVSIAGIYDLKHTKELENLLSNKIEIENHDPSEEEHIHTFKEVTTELQYHLLDYRINTIYLPNRALLNYKSMYNKYVPNNSDDLELPYQSYFRLKNWGYGDDFKAFANNKISKFYNIKSMKEEYKEHLIPISNASNLILIVSIISFFIFYFFGFLFINYNFKNKKEISFLFQEGYSKDFIINLIYKKKIFLNILIFLLAILGGILFSNNFLSSDLFISLVNRFTPHSIQTGSNLEILEMNSINFDFIYAKHANLNLIYFLVVVLIFVVFSILEKKIISTAIEKKVNA